MKLKKTILGLAVVAVAGVNAWLANSCIETKNGTSMLNVENIADAYEVLGADGDWYYSGSKGTFWDWYAAEIWVNPNGTYSGIKYLICKGDMTPPITCSAGTKSQRDLTSEEAAKLYQMGRQ